MSTPMLGTGPMRGFGPMLGVGPMLGRSPLSGPVSQRPTFALDFARDQYSTLSPALTVSSPTGGVMVPDYLGNYHKTLANEIPIRGGRRKRQLISKTEDFSDASWLVYGGTTKVGETVVAGVPVMEVSLGTTGGAIGGASALYRSTDIAPAGVNRRVAFWVRAKSGTSSVRVEINEVVSSDTGDVSISDAVWTRIALSKTEAADGNAQIALRTNVAGTSGNVYVALATCYTGEHQDDLPDVYTSDTIEEPEYVSRGVLSSPYHGYGVDGLAWMRTDPEGNSLADGLASVLYESDFSSASGWGLTNATITGGQLNLSPSATVSRGIGLVVGKRYQVTYTIKSIAPGTSNIRVFVGSTGAGTARTAPGTYTEAITCAGAPNLYFFTGSGFGSGVVDNISVREVYPVPCTGIADWPQVTNLSKSISTSWTGSPGTLVGDDPVYGLPMLLFTSAGAAETSRRQSTTTLAGSTEYTARGYLVAGTAPYAYVRALSVPSGGAQAVDGVWFDLAAVAVSTIGTGITSATIEEEFPGLLKWTVTFTTAASITLPLFDLGQANGAGVLTSTSGHTLKICDYVQINAGSVALPLVPTTTAAVTADAIVKTLDDSLIGWVAGGGTMIVEQTPEQDASTGDILIDIKTDADNRILVSGAGGNTQLLVRDGATDVATINGTGWQAGVTQRVAAKVEANDAELVIDGESEGTDTSLTVPAITTITLGGGQAKSIGAIAYYAAGA